MNRAKEMIKILLEHKDLDINYRNKLGCTALMFAANLGELEIV
jgi:ankyrin repeat protein